MTDEFMLAAFHGRKFMYAESDFDPGSSNWTFQDEANIREQYWNIKTGDVVFDVGAAWGSYTLTALVCGAKVYAFEPDDRLRKELRRSVNLNKFSQCWILPNIVSDEDSNETVEFRGSLIHPGNIVVGWARTSTIDTLAKDWIHWPSEERLDWIKVDVEGAELKVMQGAESTLKKFMPNLIIELHIGVDNLNSYMIENKIPTRLHDLLTGLGYSIRTVPYLTHAFYISEGPK